MTVTHTEMEPTQAVGAVPGVLQAGETHFMLMDRCFLSVSWHVNKDDLSVESTWRSMAQPTARLPSTQNIQMPMLALSWLAQLHSLNSRLLPGGCSRGYRGCGVGRINICEHATAQTKGLELLSLDCGDMPQKCKNTTSNTYNTYRSG